jgi:hypothetical protein
MAATKKTNRAYRNDHRAEAEAALQNAIDHLTMLSQFLEEDGQDCEKVDGINDAVQDLYKAVRLIAV